MFFAQITMWYVVFIVAYISFHAKWSTFRGSMIFSLVGIIAVSLLYVEGAFLYILLAAIGVAYLLHRILIPKIMIVQYAVIDEDEKPEHIDLKI